jgi:hypothetical protein
VTPLVTEPAGRVRAEVRFDRDGTATTDARTVDLAGLRPLTVDLGDAAPPCPHDEGPGATGWLFAASAGLVVAGYVGMLTRYVRGR